MIEVQKNIKLASLTTLGVGGNAKFFVDAKSVDDVVDTLVESELLGLGVAVFGGGSNILVPDVGIDGIVLHLSISGIELVKHKNELLIVAGAGVVWNDLVVFATKNNFWGIENLAAIPGTVGAAPVQNISAYGSELSNVFVWADVVERSSKKIKRIYSKEAMFGYRDSIFKKEHNWIITHVAIKVFRNGNPNIKYKDLKDLFLNKKTPTTSSEVATAVREIRSKKLPPINIGSAGSFFKNPIISNDEYTALCKRIPGVPGFVTGDGVKVQLAWILDNVLSLRGVYFGSVGLYKKHPLILVTSNTSTEADILKCSEEVIKRVYDATGIVIEREVQTFSTQ